MATKTKQDAAKEPKFPKQSILRFKRFEEHRDLLGALLDDRYEYTLKEAEAAIETFRKGKVK